MIYKTPEPDCENGRITAATAKSTSTTLESASKLSTTSTITKSGPGVEPEPIVETSTSNVKTSTTNFSSSVAIERAEDKFQRKPKPADQPDFVPPVKPERQPKPEVAKGAKEVPEVAADAKPKSQVNEKIQAKTLNMRTLTYFIMGSIPVRLTSCLTGKSVDD